MEICSSWGISEEGGEGRYQSVRHALEMGYRFGFTGGTDNHSAEPGNPDLGGITGVLAPALTREAQHRATLIVQEISPGKWGRTRRPWPPDSWTWG